MFEGLNHRMRRLLAAVALVALAGCGGSDDRPPSGGDHAYGRTGTGLVATVVETPTVVPRLANVIEVNGDEFHGLALTRSGAVYAWGRNDLNALDGTGTPVSSPTPIPSGFSR